MDSFEFAGFKFPRHIPQLVSPSCCGTPDALKRPAGRKHRYKVSASYYRSPWPIVAGHPKDEDGFYHESDFAPGLRWQWCDDIVESINHKGWYTNDDGYGDTIRGVVWRLPHGRGFLAGHAMGKGMSAALSRRIWKSEWDAGREADQMAERCAEEERDYNRAYDAGQQAAELDAEAKAIRGELIPILAELRRMRRQALDVPALCGRLASDVKSMLAEIQEKRAERDKLRVEHTPDLDHAFAEGFKN